MADLIIKSSTGSGNNLLIQGADSSPAITIAETGTTTFAENATLSGTANVYGQGTFPAGHVIQTVTNSHTAQSVARATASYAIATVSGGAQPYTGQITGVASNSTVLVHMSWLAYMSTDGIDGTSWCLYREGTIIYQHTSGHQWYFGGSSITEPSQFYHPMSWSIMDTDPGTGTVNYYLGHRVYSSASSSVESNQPFQIILQEIQG